jgi:hypothetical protein
MRYDNVYSESPRLIFKKDNGKYGSSLQFHPRDWFFWLHHQYKLAWLFFPVFFMANVLTCFTPYEETSGKLLMFMRLECGSRWSKLILLNKKICYFLLRKRYGSDWIDKICSIYFWQRKDSPIRLASKGLEL